MSTKLKQCCDFVYSVKRIKWTHVTILICLAPFGLLLLILVLLFLLSVEQTGSVVSNTLVCATIGKEVLDDGGSAVDAAIATLVCEGISLPNSAGIGGGFTAVMYENGKFDSIVASPTVPLFVQNNTVFDETYSQGAKSAGVPGELMGYWEMHKKYGVLDWKRLFTKSIELCEQGIPMTEWMSGIFRISKERIAKSKTMGKIFDFSEYVDSARDNKMKFPILARTLRRIAEEGVRPFYRGDIGARFVEDLREEGGQLTQEDLKNYKVIWDENPPSLNLHGVFKIVSTPLPTSGVLTVFAFNMLRNYNLLEPGLFCHRFIEAMKHTFGHSALLGDPVNDPQQRERILQAYDKLTKRSYAREIRDLINDKKVAYDPSHYGWPNAQVEHTSSASICVLSPKGGAVAVTTSLQGEFGGFFASEQTGIIPNNLLSKFAHKMNNFPKIKVPLPNRPLPGKHMFSPFSPTLVLRKRTSDPFLILGASGGSKATTFVVTALVRYVLNVSTGEEAANTNYLHNQLNPNEVQYEVEPEEVVFNYLTNAGHKLIKQDASFENYSALTLIGLRLRHPDAHFDNRVGGSIARVDAKSDLNILLVILIGGQAAAIIGLMLYEVLNPKAQILFPYTQGDQQTEA